jgi:thioredoxin reductase (NADPH)
MSSRNNEWYEVAIVGGGPAGLAAAVYLRRFLRSTIVFDAGDARAKLIPKTHNCPGFPEGISGVSLLKRLKRQATRYGTRTVTGCVDWLEKRQGGFYLQTSLGRVGARCVILATGVVDQVPAIPKIKNAIKTGSIRLCPVCDAYEVQDRRVGVVGPEDDALREGIFLRHFAHNVSILCNSSGDFSPAGRARAKQEGIEVWDAVDDFLQRSDGFEVVMANGDPARTIDVIYPCMGCDVRSELAVAVGAECDREGYVLVEKYKEFCATIMAM